MAKSKPAKSDLPTVEDYIRRSTDVNRHAKPGITKLPIVRASFRVSIARPVLKKDLDSSYYEYTFTNGVSNEWAVIDLPASFRVYADGRVVGQMAYCKNLRYFYGKMVFSFSQVLGSGFSNEFETCRLAVGERKSDASHDQTYDPSVVYHPYPGQMGFDTI